MKRLILLALLVTFILQNVFAQSFEVSSNGRYLMKEGKPFFWLGDTAWELFHRLSREEADFYLKKRASQGYTLIQAVALAELDGLNVPNAYGDLPLKNNDPTQPNEAYFKHVDYIIDKAGEMELTIGFLPTWGDKLFKASWGLGPEVFNPMNAKAYGKWLGNRYKNRKNIIWILGGDRNPRQSTNDTEVWRAMAAGIAEGLGGYNKALMTFHPQPNKDGASEWFHNDEWLDFNMFQTGHCRDTPVFDNIQGSYDHTLIKPVLNGEPIYEDHPVCFNAADLGISNAYDVRKAAYLSLFAGAFGHTYGCHDIWQMYTQGKAAVNGATMDWKLALDLPGAGQMQHARKLMESRPILDRVPDQSIIVGNDRPSYERIQATRGLDYAFIYTATGIPFSVKLGMISGTFVRASWFNPRNGKTEEFGKIKNSGTKQFDPPASGYGQDWILILDNASKDYPLIKIQK